MPKNWKTYKFSELFETASGLSKSRDQFGFGSPFLTFKDVFYNYFLPAELGDLANTSEKEQIRGSVKRGDIFLTRTSETLHELGMSSVALKDYPNSTFNGFCKRLRQKKSSAVKIHPEFMGYFLRSNSFRNEVSQHATMTTRASLNNTSISSLSVTLPLFDEQVEIGEILKTLDDKIELNLQMNQTLEEMAMASYKHWFIDFGPFQDGEFVDSELGEIPEGWEVKNVHDLMEVIYGAPFKSKLFNEDKKGYPLIRIRDLKSGNPQYFTDENHSKKTIIQKGDILAGMDALFTPYAWSGEVAVLNQRVVLFRPKNDGISRRFIYEAVRPWLKFYEGAKVGTTVIHLSKSDIDGFKFIYPIDHNIVHDFHSQLETWHQKIINNHFEIKTLTQLRDTLLPKLISGEVRVKDAEKTVTEVL